MQALPTSQRINLSNAKAIRRARELLKLTREELAGRIGFTYKAIEKYENGRAELDEGKITLILEALNLTPEEYKNIKKGKGIGLLRKQKSVFANAQRRSYRREITKEVRVLKVLRQMKGFTQDQASAACGYSRPSIGHIENGRIELDLERIQHIVESYSLPIEKFHELMKEEILRDEIISSCHEKILLLPEEKLKLVQSVLANL